MYLLINFMGFIYLSWNLDMDPDYIKLNEIKPALAGYIKDSQALMKELPFPDERTIHDVRVLMKMARAVLKLVAPQLDREYIARDIRALREVGRKMCTWRESSVLRKAIKEYRKKYPGLFSRLEADEKIIGLLKKPENITDPSEKLKEELEEIDELLKRTGFRIRFQSMNRIDPHLLIRELELTYGVVTDMYLICRNNLKSDKIHEFRKKAKDFQYQLSFFRPLNPSKIKYLEKKLDSMIQFLGRYNDLTQLVKALEYEYSVNKNTPAMDELVIRIRESQDRYLDKIWPAAYKIFCPGTKLVNLLGFKLLII